MPRRPLLALSLLATACGSPGWRAASPRAAPSPPRSGHLACADGDGRVWLFGGYAEVRRDGPRHLPIALEREPTDDLWLFDGEGWSCVAPPSAGGEDARPGPRLCSAGAVVDGELLLFGGWDPRPAGTGGAILGDAWALDLKTRVWRRLADMPRGPTSRHVACRVGDHLLVHTHRCASALLRWDRAAGRLVEQPTTGDAPSARGLHVAAALSAHEMLVFGGASQAGAMSDEAFILDTRSWAWSAVRGAGAGPSPRAGAAAAAAGDGRAVVFGGAERAARGGGGLLARGDAWLFEAGRAGQPPCWSLLAADAPAGGTTARPRARNAATLSPLAPAPGGAPRLLLHGGWQPFVETYGDTHVLELSPSTPPLS
ncbi:hypothetical protein KFE25_006211 [Diacronema lutheri]|uniref:Galactose oxidase n=1 Tax=Diacronema lutheri TaxID=2081491 RepID=A0A8J5XVH5_DIALT|nr:hypothetical protein KFE25_006211 [Diacronema lutheri]